MFERKKMLVEKRNVLNEIRSNSMNIQELRFFSIYLARINARDISTRVVRFKLIDFQRIMDFGKLNLTQLRNATESLLCKLVEVPLDTGGFKKFQLFKMAVFTKNKNDEWYIEIDAHDEALPLMFEFKEKYFTYELWNALRLKSSNQFRMYEILKQYEVAGERVIEVDKLRDWLGLEPSEYARFASFRTSVLDVCQEALEKHTDIRFTYEPYGNKGKSGKILRLKFTVSKNPNYKDQLSLDEFIDYKELTDIIAVDEFDLEIEEDNEEDSSEGSILEREIYPLLSDVCKNEFNDCEIEALCNLIIKIMPWNLGDKESHIAKMGDYMKQKYDVMRVRTARKDLSEVKSRFGYLKKILEMEIEE